MFRNNPWWWYLLFPVAVLWAGIAGIPALALLFTAPPVGFLALLVATGPGLGLIVWGLNYDLKKAYRR